MLSLVVDHDRWRRPEGATRVAATWADHQGRPFATGFVCEPERWIEWPGLGSFHFDRHSSLVRFHPDAGVDLDTARSFFEKIVQPVILQAQGHIVVHGSAAGGPDGAVILCGSSGSGKSTLAFALAGLEDVTQVADDAVLVRPGNEGGFVVQPLPFDARLRPSAASHFASRRHGHERLLSQTPLCAVVVLEQVSVLREASLEPVAPAAAFSMLLTHAHAFDADDRTAAAVLVDQFLALAAAVPVYRLRYRPDFARLPHLATRVAALVGHDRAARPQ